MLYFLQPQFSLIVETANSKLNINYMYIYQAWGQIHSIVFKYKCKYLVNINYKCKYKYLKKVFKCANVFDPNPDIYLYIYFMCITSTFTMYL